MIRKSLLFVLAAMTVGAATLTIQSRHEIIRYRDLARM